MPLMLSSSNQQKCDPSTELCNSVITLAYHLLFLITLVETAKNPY